MLAESAAPAEGRGSRSQYKDDYQSWQIDRPSAVQQQQQWQPPTGAVAGSTVTSESFPAHPVQPRQQRERQQWLPPTEEFRGQSVNKSDFQPKYLPKEQPIKPKDELTKSTAAFAGQSGSHAEFQPWPVQPRYRHQPPEYRPPSGEMESSSSYAREFPTPPKDSRVRLPPIRPQRSTETLQRFEGVSESHQVFQAYKRSQVSDAKQASCRPLRQYQPPSQPFHAASSYSGDFADDAKLKVGARTRPFRPEGELKLPKEPLQASATTASDFKPAGRPERRQPIRHDGELRCSQEPFGGVSTQRGDFTPRRAERLQPIRHADQTVASSEPFAATSVTRDDFVGVRGQRQSPVKYQGELQLSKEPMDSTTTSRAIFTPKQRDGPPPRRRQQAVAG